MENKVLSRKYDYLIKFANDVIIIFDKDLKIVQVNEKAVSSYRYSSSEFLGMGLKDLQADTTIPALSAEFDIIEKKGNHIFKTVHKRKDGTAFPVEISMQHYVIEWNEFYQAIIRDISERDRS